MIQNIAQLKEDGRTSYLTQINKTYLSFKRGKKHEKQARIYLTVKIYKLKLEVAGLDSDFGVWLFFNAFYGWE